MRDGDKDAARDAWSDALALNPDDRDRARIASYLSMLDLAAK